VSLAPGVRETPGPQLKLSSSRRISGPLQRSPQRVNKKRGSGPLWSCSLPPLRQFSIRKLIWMKFGPQEERGRSKRPTSVWIFRFRCCATVRSPGCTRPRLPEAMPSGKLLCEIQGVGVHADVPLGMGSREAAAVGRTETWSLQR
jgi:hypothetical protein